MTTFHCADLCSKACCNPLRWALEYAQDERRAELFRQYPPQTGDTGDLQEEYEAICAVLDTAAVAELYVLALRARGLLATAWASGFGLIGLQIGDFTPMLFDDADARNKLHLTMQLPLPNTCDKCGATVECSPIFPSGYDYYCKTHSLTNVAMSTFKIREECERILTRYTMSDPRVDDSMGMRPAVMGGECSRCLHVPPLHEPTCRTLKQPTCPFCKLPWGDHPQANGKIERCPENQ